VCRPSLNIDLYLQQNPGVPPAKSWFFERRQLGNVIRDSRNTDRSGRTACIERTELLLRDALKPILLPNSFELFTLMLDPDDRPSLRYWLASTLSIGRTAYNITRPW